MLSRIEYSVTVPGPAERAFKALQNLDRLLGRGIYTEAVWVEGPPWQVGSRLRYVFVKPIPVTVSAVVAAINPPRSISLLNHAMGVTAEQNITFNADQKGGTLVRMTMELIGKSTELSEAALHSKITFVMKDALDTMAALCS
jgi:hypothetical protein